MLFQKIYFWGLMKLLKSNSIVAYRTKTLQHTITASSPVMTFRRAADFRHSYRGNIDSIDTIISFISFVPQCRVSINLRHARGCFACYMSWRCSKRTSKLQILSEKTIWNKRMQALLTSFCLSKNKSWNMADFTNNKSFWEMSVYS